MYKNGQLVQDGGEIVEIYFPAILRNGKCVRRHGWKIFESYLSEMSRNGQLLHFEWKGFLNFWSEMAKHGRLVHHDWDIFAI